MTNRIRQLSLFLLVASAHLPLITSYKFALVPKHLNSIFFDVSRDGCLDRAKFLSKQQENVEIECIYTGPFDFNPDGVDQAAAVRELIEQGDIDGLSISVLNAETMRPVINEAVAKGIPVVTFDSDDPGSDRASYIGTDNFFFGEQLGKVLQQIQPTGGTYVIVGDETPNVVARENGVRASLQQESKTDWKELSISPLDAKGNYSLAIDIMRDALRNNNITAVVPTFGGPMFLGQQWTDLVDEFPDVIFVVADGLQVQLDFLARGKVDGLVAQLPYNMGSMSMDSLLLLKTAAFTGQAKNLLPSFQGTNVLEHVMVPLILPDLTVNQNLLGNLRYVGFGLFSVITLTSLFFLGWTYINRSVRVVQAAQPGFLALLAFGVLIMGASILPLSFDDSDPDYTPEMGDLRCMTIPWMLFIGFTLIFAALFAKLWRINHLFQSSARFKRVTLKTKDVIIPMVTLLTANAATLTWWTLTDPLRYKRVDLEGTDAWNRVIGTWGGCTSQDPVPYSLVIGVLNVGVMVVASWQAYRARKIKSEFAESKYVAMALVSMLQVSLIGMPLLVLVRKDPRAWYWTMSLMVFIMCMVVLLVIFIPKMMHFRRHALMNDASQRRVLADSIRKTQHNLNDTQKGTISEPGSGRALNSMNATYGSGHHVASLPNTNTFNSVQADQQPDPAVLSDHKKSSSAVKEDSDDSDGSDLQLKPGSIKNYLGEGRSEAQCASSDAPPTAMQQEASVPKVNGGDDDIGDTEVVCKQPLEKVQASKKTNAERPRSVKPPSTAPDPKCSPVVPRRVPTNDVEISAEFSSDDEGTQAIASGQNVSEKKATSTSLNRCPTHSPVAPRRIPTDFDYGSSDEIMLE